MTYTAPLADIRFALREVAGLGRVASLPGYEHATDDTVDALIAIRDACRAEGIMVDTGMLLNPLIDTAEYIGRIPALLRECGIHVPTFCAFESPIPGTPHFKRLAAQETPALLPGALLRDFTGYTLVTRPRRESLEDFVAAYRGLCAAVGSREEAAQLGARDLPSWDDVLSQDLLPVWRRVAGGRPPGPADALGDAA